MTLTVDLTAFVLIFGAICFVLGFIAHELIERDA
jgi:hypothetical protein